MHKLKLNGAKLKMNKEKEHEHKALEIWFMHLCNYK